MMAAASEDGRFWQADEEDEFLSTHFKHFR